MGNDANIQFEQYFSVRHLRVLLAHVSLNKFCRQSSWGSSSYCFWLLQKVEPPSTKRVSKSVFPIYPLSPKSFPWYFSAIRLSSIGSQTEVVIALYSVGKQAFTVFADVVQMVMFEAAEATRMKMIRITIISAHSFGWVYDGAFCHLLAFRA